MRAVHLAAVDLNLLVALDALLAERSVTRASKKLGLSQPATSRALARLRDLFADPLLVRAPGGLTPTPRAERLIDPVRRALSEIERVVQDRGEFDPANEHRAFRMLMTDHGAIALLPDLIAALTERAPHIDLEVAMQRAEPEIALAEGVVDLFVGALIRDVPGIYSQKLFDEELVCVVRAGHPRVGKTLTLARFVELPHALVSPRGRGRALVDHALAERGLSRRIALRIPHFAVAPVVIARTDLVLTIPRRVASAFASLPGIRILPPPLELETFSLHQLWHERHHADPAHVWFRGEVLAAAKGRS